MKTALMHTYPQWEPPEDDANAPSEEWGEVWYGKMRIVHKQRARKLRRRGVPLMSLPHWRAWAWFVDEGSVRAFTSVDLETAKRMQDEFRERHPNVIAAWNRRRAQ